MLVACKHLFVNAFWLIIFCALVLFHCACDQDPDMGKLPLRGESKSAALHRHYHHQVVVKTICYSFFSPKVRSDIKKVEKHCFKGIH